MEESVLLLKGRLHKGTPESAGFDLFATEPITLFSGQRQVVNTGVVTKLNPGIVGLIRDRSSLAANYGITVLAGVIDADYDKEWKVVLLNTGQNTVAIPTGDRIAQVLFLNVFQDVKTTENSTVTYGADNRVGGFGSTGN
jgi:dUTP pyrophosphatase